MEYKMIITERRDYWETTSYYGRKKPSDSWETLDLDEVKPDTLEKVIVDSALKIAKEGGKKRTKVVIKVTQ